MTGPTNRPPRRSALLRTTTVVGAAVPLCLAGWFGWQAVSHDAPAGATAATGTGAPRAAPRGAPPRRPPPPAPAGGDT
ncbi:N-acetylmuramoyl-L-alanine amidase, partial [Kitasatospora sp. NPDC059722]